jgi:predicted MFS family arabinose efflux permease
MSPIEPQMKKNLLAKLTDPFVAAVGSLGIHQITAWGTSYYCLGVLAVPLGRDTGWSLSLIYFGFTVALLTMGLVSTWVGRAIDHYGARRVMTLGALLVSAGMVALSLVRSETAYLAVWSFVGLGMRMYLYDAAFAALVQVVPSRGRQAISYLTLFGAFASSVFWVLGHFLNEAFGWRQTLMLFAAINLVVCLPLSWFGLARRETSRAGRDPDEKSGPPADPPLRGRLRSVAIALFALIMSLNGLVFGVVTVQLVPLLGAAGLTTAAAVWIASTKGFAQFGGRIIEIFFGRNLHVMTVARVAIGVLPFSFLLLIFAGGHFQQILAFTLLMGASQGVITIVRGSVPLVLFGPTGYATVLGLIATPILIVNAAAPTLCALVVDRWGWQNLQVVLLACSTASWLAMELMSRWYRRNRSRGGNR